MAGSVMLSSASVPVAPGGAGTCSIRIRNTGTVVDQFTVSVLGDPASWTTITPATISLFPGAEGTVELHFGPPRGPLPVAGPLPFGVRVVPTEDPDGSVVEEGNIDLQPFTEITAKITPRTSEAKRSARHEILVDNRGNTTVEANIEASDPDEQLAFELKPRVLTVAPGDTARAAVKVAARKGFARGSDKHRPFTVTVTPGPGQPASRLDGTLIQHAGLPRLLIPAGVAVIALALIAFVAVPALGGKTGSSSGLFNLTSDKDEVTATTLDEEAAAAAQAEAEAKEAQAAAEGEAAANGKDSSVTTAPSSKAGPTAAGSGPSAGAPPGADTAAAEEETPLPTAAPAAAPTTAAPATTVAPTTTTPVTSDMYYVWKQEDDGQARPYWIGGGNVGQTFKATQPKLISAGVNLAGGRVTVNVRKGGPVGAIVGTSGSVPIVSFGETTVTFAGSPALTVGQIYYLEAVGDSGDMTAWYSNTNDYPDGDGFLNGGAQGHDLNARVTGRSS